MCSVNNDQYFICAIYDCTSMRCLSHLVLSSASSSLRTVYVCRCMASSPEDKHAPHRDTGTSSSMGMAASCASGVVLFSRNMDMDRDALCAVVGTGKAGKVHRVASAMVAVYKSLSSR